MKHSSDKIFHLTKNILIKVRKKPHPIIKSLKPIYIINTFTTYNHCFPSPTHLVGAELTGGSVEWQLCSRVHDDWAEADEEG